MGSPFSGDLQLIEPDAAAVDVGSRSHWVAVNPQRDPNPVREFGTFTADLISLADWLAQCEAKSVVMEAIYELLERRGFKVYVVDAHTVRHLPGRSKSDVKDCQWLRRLHSYGLLRGSFRPPAQIRQLRNYLRSRTKIVEAAAQQQLRISPTHQTIRPPPEVTASQTGLHHCPPSGP